MRRLVVLGATLALFALAATASAAGPAHLKFSLTDTEFAPAGELCDFDYSASFTAEVNTIVFGDPNDPTRFIEHVALVKTHTNVDTGLTLSETDHFTTEFNAATEQVKQVGIFWHLRDPSGKLVVIQAGQVLFDTSTGELLKVTPNVNPDFAAVICPALGGSPAT
jgi:hypothetical protein